MTGVEHLRELAKILRENIGDMRLNSSSGPLWRIIADIADQIKREHAEDCFRMGEQAADVSMSAYDLLPQDEREAIAWVREHGGLGAVKKMAAITLDVYQRLVDGNAGLEMLETDADTIDAMMAEIDEAIVKRGKERTTALALLEESVSRVTYERHIIKRQRQIDESHAALRRRNERIAELEHERGELYEMVRSLNAQMDEMDLRLMPEGMEWPRFDDGEPVRPGDKLQDKDGDWFEAVSFVFTCDWWSIRGYQTEGFGDLNEKTRRTLEGISYGERVKRPAPKVLDAEGAEIRVGDTVWTTRDLDRFTVTNPNNGEFLSVSCKDEGGDDYCCHPSDLTHRAPILAADGKPLREGEHVWHVETGTELVVKELPKPGAYQAVVVFAPPASHLTSFDPDQLTHERPDSWERLEEDCAKSDVDYCAERGLLDSSCDTVEGDGSTRHCTDCGCTCGEKMARDLVRRAKALAGDA